MAKPLDLVGKTFNWLTVQARKGSNARGQSLWECSCKCGSTTTVLGTLLQTGHTRSCGCLAVEKQNERCTVHGLRHHPIWRRWAGCIQRCYNANNPAFADYGGRGIFMCEFLRASPAHLLEILGELPSKAHSIDRVNNALNYTCGQCAECLKHGHPLNIRWATRTEQNRNTRRNRLVTIEGITKTLSQWSDESGLWHGTIRHRLKKGYEPLKPI